jgi:sugar diacid utilization regulator
VGDRHLDEQRRMRDMVTDLVAGTADSTAYARARDLGYDLHQPHWMVATGYRARRTDGALARSVERAADSLSLGSLLTRHRETVLLLARQPGGAVDPWWRELHEEVSRRVDGPPVEIGVGSSCRRPGDVPRSWHGALRALTVRRAARIPGGVIVYDELRIEDVLPAGTSGHDAWLFVRSWLGPVLDHDRDRGTDLLTTLSAFLDNEGDLVATAAELSVHRSTLRYRLHRVSGISLRGGAVPDGRSGPDIHDHQNWPRLRVAIWVSQILDASMWEVPLS